MTSSRAVQSHPSPEYLERWGAAPGETATPGGGTSLSIVSPPLLRSPEPHVLPPFSKSTEWKHPGAR